MDVMKKNKSCGTRRRQYNAIACVALVFCFLFVPSILLSAIQDVAREADLMAVYVFNFIKYIHWPDEEQDDEFAITIIGDCEFADQLKEIAKKKKVRGRKIRIAEVENVNGITDSHILLIAESEIPNLKEILSNIKDIQAVTVAYYPGSADIGVAINLVMQDNRIRFEFNKLALEDTGVTVSSKLLKLAKFVSTSGR